MRVNYAESNQRRVKGNVHTLTGGVFKCIKKDGYMEFYEC